MNDVDAICSDLRFQLNYLADIANIDPEQFRGRETTLYGLMNGLQLITSRFAPVVGYPTPANDTTGLDAQLGLVARALRALPDGAA